MDTTRVPLNNVESAQLTEPAPPPLATHVNSQSVPVIVGAFWGVLGLVIIILSCLILWHMSKRRHRALVQQIEWQRRQAEEQRQRTDSQDSNASQKPVSIPIVVVLPNDEFAFGWEVPSPKDDGDCREDSLESSLDSIDLKPEKEWMCSSGDTCCGDAACDNDTIITASSSGSSSYNSPV